MQLEYPIIIFKKYSHVPRLLLITTQTVDHVMPIASLIPPSSQALPMQFSVTCGSHVGRAWEQG